MGFGSFLKSAINPLTPFKMVAGATKQTLKGNPMGALKASIGMNPGGKQPRQQAGPYGGIMAGQKQPAQGIGGMLANRFAQQPQQPQMKQAGMMDAPQMAQPQQGGFAPQMMQAAQQMQPQMQQQAPQQQPEMDYEALKAQYGVQRAREMMAGQ